MLDLDARPDLITMQMGGVKVEVVPARAFQKHPVYVETPGYFVDSFGAGCPNDGPNTTMHILEAGGRVTSLLKGHGESEVYIVNPNMSSEPVVSATSAFFRENHRSNSSGKNDHDGIFALRAAVSHPLGQRLAQIVQGDGAPGDHLVWVSRREAQKGRDVKNGAISEANARFARQAVLMLMPDVATAGRVSKFR